MKKTILVMAVVFVAFSYAVPAFAYGPDAATLFTGGFWGPILSCTGNYISGDKPCTSICDILNTLKNIIYLAMSVAIYIITPIMVGWGGVMLLISGGSPEKVASGRKIVTGTVVGVAIMLGAYLIIATFFNLIGAKNKDSWFNVQCSAMGPTQQIG